MIVFRGELSDRSKKILNREMSHIIFFATSITALILSVFITLAVVYYDWICAFLYFFVLPLFLLPVLSTSKKYWNNLCPTEISINDEIVIINGDEFYQERDISNLKSIIDYGDSYRMQFLFPHKAFSCLCQKDLIVEGTIEEFEERFSEFIVRKTKK